MTTLLRTLRTRVSPVVNRCERIYRDVVPGAKWARERQFVAGKYRPPSNRQSIVLLTVHKCASVFLGYKLADLAREAGLVPLNLQAYGFTTGKPISAPLCPHGFFFGPLRSLSLIDPAHTDLSKFRTILVVRDPRDVLTSLYYSLAFSHHIPRTESGRNLLKARDGAQSQDVDSWVHAAAAGYARRYEGYANLLTGQASSGASIHLCKYEDLVADPQGWLAELVQFLQVDVSPTFLTSLLTKQDFAVDGEDHHSHKRQVTPGDHARKLRPITIAKLNHEFARVMHVFGYSASQPGALAHAS